MNSLLYPPDKLQIADDACNYCHFDTTLIQVEHTVTEQVTGLDIVQSTILIAGGASLEDIGLVQEKIIPVGVAMQCRITTEDPARGFAPDTGIINVSRHSMGVGIRIDGYSYDGMLVQPFFDSLIVKYTATHKDWDGVIRRMRRALRENHIRGVKTNIPFLLNGKKQFLISFFYSLRRL